MNLNGDEKRIQQLFREMSVDEEKRVSEFARVLANDFGRARIRNQAHSLRLVVTVTALVGALLLAIALIVIPARPDQTTAKDQNVIPERRPESKESAAPSPSAIEKPTPRGTIVARVRRRRTVDRTTIAMKSLFAWRSPTESLLRTGGDDLLRTLPRLGESLHTIKTYSPEQFN